MSPRWILGLLVGLALGCPKPPSSTWPEVGAMVPEIQGSSHEGVPFRLRPRTERGPVFLFFGYTYCPDVCPITLLTLKRLLATFSKEEADRVAIVFVTVDPKRDTIERLAEYLGAFDVDVTGVRPASLDVLVRDLGLSVEKTNTSTDSELYTVNHTATVFLIGESGRVVARFPHGTEKEKMRGPLQTLLRPGGI